MAGREKSCAKPGFWGVLFVTRCFAKRCKLTKRPENTDRLSTGPEFGMVKPLMRNRFVAAAALVAGFMVVGLLAGCGGKTFSGEDARPDPTLLFVNASLASVRLDFLMNDALVDGNVAFLGTSPDFRSFRFISESDGGYDASIRPAGGGEEFDRFGFAPARESHSIAMAIGTPDFGTEFLKRCQILAFMVDRERPTGNRARVTFINALLRAPGSESPPVRFQTIDPDDPFSEENPLFSVSDVQYASVGDSQTLAVDATTLTFQARRSDVDGVVVFAEREFAFGAGKIYLGVLTGQEGATDPALRPTIRFIELTPEP